MKYEPYNCYIKSSKMIFQSITRLKLVIILLKFETNRDDDIHLHKYSNIKGYN